jgi:hypothetical protein
MSLTGFRPILKICAKIYEGIDSPLSSGHKALARLAKLDLLEQLRLPTSPEIENQNLLHVCCTFFFEFCATEVWR